MKLIFLDNMRIEIDSIGNIIWQDEISNSGADYLRALTKSHDGGILLAGTTHDGCQDDRWNIVKKYVKRL